MSQTPMQPSLRSASRITLSDPIPEEPQTYYANSKVTFVIDFDPESAGFSRRGADLLIQGVNGGQIALNGFFADAGASMPKFELQSGTELSGHDFIQMYSQDLLSPTSFIPRAIPHLYGEVNEANLDEGTQKDPAALKSEIGLPEGYNVDVSKGGWEANGSVYELRQEGNPGYLTYDPDTNTLTHTLTGNVENAGEGNAFLTYSGIAIKNGDLETVLDAKIEVLDDAPVVDFGSYNPSDYLSTGDPFYGTWNVDFGADGPSESGSALQISVLRPGHGSFTADVVIGTPVNIVIDGKPIGTLLLNADNTYVFQAEWEMHAYLEFTLLAMDKDGDVSSSAEFSMAFYDSEDKLFFPPIGPDVSFDEADLSGGPFQKEIPLPDPDNTTIRTEAGTGWLQGEGNTLYKQGTYGKLIYDKSDGKVYYRLEKAAEHDAQGKDSAYDVFKDVRVNTEAGTNKVTDFVIKITDDVPTVSATAPDKVESGNSIVGDLTAHFGQDGPADDGSAYAVIIKNQYGQSVRVVVAPGVETELSIDGFTYGSIKLETNGKFTFTAEPNLNEKVYLSFEVTDGDGDTARTSSPIEISIDKPEPPEIDDPIGHGQLFDEANLDQGTAPSDPALTKELEIPDGYAVHTDGWEVQPDGTYTLKGDYGHLTYNPQDNKLFYTLESNAINAPDSDLAKDVFEVIQVKDDKGNIYDLSAEISIEDDKPVVGLGANGTGAETGKPFPGSWDINYGADGDGGMSLKVTTADGEFNNFPIQLGQNTIIEIDGVNYGTIIFNADKTYTFTPTADTESKLQFVLSGTDGDGDTVSSSPFEVTSTKPNPPVVEPGDLENWYAESGLVSGTAPGENIVKELKIPGTPGQYTVDTTSWTPDGNGGFTKQLQYGKLTYDPQGNGKLTYTLESNASHKIPGKFGAEDVVEDDAAIVLKDSVGNTFGVNVNIDVRDDAPELDFKADKTEGQAGYDFEGTWDIQYGADGKGSMSLEVGNGADKVVIPNIEFDTAYDVVIGGKNYGSITFDATGKYVFTAAPNTESTLTFVLGATDGDGDFVDDPNPFTVTFDEPEKPTPGPDDLTNWFSESYLKNGTRENDPNASDLLTKELNIPDGYHLDTAGWTKNSDGTFTLKGKYGQLTYDEQANELSYTLSKAAMHKDPTASGADDTLLDNMNVVLKDDGNNTWSVPTKIEIRDDAPILSFGADDNEAESGYAFTGNWQVLYGADGKGAMAISVDDGGKNEPFLVTIGKAINLNIDGVNYGKLTFHSNGTYTFQPAANYEGSLRFVLMAMDKDGDVRYGGEPFEIITKKPEGPDPNDDPFAKQIFSESNLGSGTDPDAGALTKTFDIDFNKYTVDTTGWTKVGALYVKEGKFGVLTYDPAGKSLSYTLQNAAEHGKPGTATDQEIYDPMNIVLKDSAGNTWEIPANIRVGDDAPVPDMTAPASEAESGHAFDGAWSVKYGADGDGQKMFIRITVGSDEQDFEITFGQPIALVINGNEYGSIVFNQNGTYTYTPAPNSEFDISFALGATDGDGDLRFDSTELQLGIVPPPPPPVGPGDLSNGFYESALDTGTGSVPGETVVKELQIPAGYFVDPTGWTDNNDGTYSLKTAYGTLTYTENGNKLTYTLQTNAVHTKPDSDETVNDDTLIILKDSGNNTWSVSTKVEVYDDAPLPNMTAPTAEAESGNNFDGAWTVNYGADGDGKAMFLKVMIDGEEATFPVTYGSQIGLVVNGTNYGNITINADGTYRFVPASNSDYTVKFALGATDGDGDLRFDDTPFEVKVTEPAGPPPPGEGNLSGGFFESALPDGTGSVPGETLVKELTVPQGFQIDTTGWTDNGDGTFSMNTAYGKLDYDSQTNKAFYTLKSNATHTDPAAAGVNDSVMDNTAIVLKDAGNNTFAYNTTITVYDDAPELSLSGDKTEATSGYEYVGEWDVDYGADGAGSLVLAVSNGTTSQNFPITPGTACVIEFGGVKYGTITFDASTNKYTFLAAPNLTAEIALKLGATDGDGDIRYSADDDGFKIKIEPPGPITVDPLEGGSHDEANLSTGTSPDDSALTKEIPLPGNGVTVDTGAAGWSETGGLYYKDVDGGQLIYNAGDNKLYFKLGERFEHTQLGKDQIDHTIKGIELLDSGKNTHVVDIKVTIVDDEPVANLVSQDLTAIEVGKDVITGDFQFQAGADAGSNETDSQITLTLDCTYESMTIVGKPIVLPKDGSTLDIETNTGILSLKYNAVNGRVEYSFKGINGLENTTESINLTIKDSEGDYKTATLNAQYNETLQDLEFKVDEAAIPDLGSSHYLLDTFEDSFTLNPALVLDNTTSVVWQGPEDPSQYRADVNGDGNYEQVTWVQDGASMKGFVGTELVVEVQAVFDNNTFTGEVKTTLYKPLQHGGTATSPTNDSLDIDLKLTQQAGGREASMDVKVTVVDDSPARDYGYNNTTHIIDIVKDPIQPQDVYVVIDVSGSIDSVEGGKAVEAIKALAQAYIDNGIDTVMTIIPFGTNPETKMLQLHPQEVIDNLSWDFLKIPGYQLTNYEKALAEAAERMDASREMPEYNSWGQTMYFITDGVSSQGNKEVPDWKDYRFNRGDSLDVYTLCIDKDEPSKTIEDRMKDIGASNDTYYYVEDYEGLLEQLVHIVQDQSYGNMLTNAASADLTSLYAITYDGHEYAVSQTGPTVIDLGNNVKLTVWRDGTYEVESGKIDHNLIKELTLKTIDADGDSRDFKANLVLRDNGSQAYDDVSVTHSFDNGIWLADFNQTQPTGTLNGSVSYGSIRDGCLIPMIDGYSDGHRGGKLSLGSDGEQKLAQVCGGEDKMNELFSEMLEMAPQDIGDNAIIKMDINAKAGGHIAFNWAFKAGQAGTDAAFWILKDKAGNIVQAGLLSRGDGKSWDSGIQHVELPDLFGDYTLYIVQQEMGTNGDKSLMYLKDVVYIPDGQLRAQGNVLTDTSPDGESDGFTQADRVHAIIYKGQELLIGDKNTFEIMDGSTKLGDLTIDHNGNYTFLANPSIQQDLVVDLTYVVKNPDGDTTSAQLYIRSEDRVFEGNDSNNVMDFTKPGLSEDGNIIKGGQGEDTILGGAGNEIIYGGHGDDSINGGGGHDLIYGGEGDDTIYGGTGNDTIYGGDGNDRLYGEDGNDVIYGGSGNDRIHGGAGDDLIYAGSGTNVITGGTGADTFGWLRNTLGGRDLITDFNTNEGDKLNFSDLLDEGESFRDYYEAGDVSHLTLGESTRVLAFLLKEDTSEGTLEKQVEIVFQDSDTQFDSMVQSYNDSGNDAAAQQAILFNFLNTIAGY